jgi:hypothetical protein
LDAAGVQYTPIVIGVDIERDRFVEENPNIRTVPHLMTEDRTITFQNVELAIEWARLNG